MTQLNLSGRESNDKPQKPAVENQNESIKNQTVGALGALAMFAAVIVIGSCSRSSKPVAVQPAVQPTPQASAPAPAVPAPAPVVAKAKKHRAATLSYVNREYGLSFNFPRTYQLKTPPKVEDATTEPTPTNFVHPGGLSLAVVEMPGNSYPGTDFKSGVFNVSVNPGMTSEACAQFAVPERSAGADVSNPVKIEPVKFGATEFHEVEGPSDATTKQAGTRYYHAFNNGACYEFALGIGTDDDRNGNVAEITPVNRQVVFARLEKILATVKLQPGVMPETQAPVPAVASTTSVDSSSGSGHEVAAPNF